MLTNKELIIKRKKREDKRKAKRRELFLKKVKALKGRKLRLQIEAVCRYLALNSEIVRRIEANKTDTAGTPQSLTDDTNKA